MRCASAKCGREAHFYYLVDNVAYVICEIHQRSVEKLAEKFGKTVLVKVLPSGRRTKPSLENGPTSA